MAELGIINGTVYDGLGRPGSQTNIYITDNRIAMVTVDRHPSDNTIDAEGRAVCPGFIDTHSHSDLQILSSSTAESKISQGITTEIVGQDGFSVAPIEPEAKPELARYLSGLAGELSGWNWSSFESYLKRVSDARPAINLASLVGNGTLRAMVIGFEKRKASADDMQRMKEMLLNGMREGALGLSSGLIYPPSMYADEEELVELCRAVAEYGGVYVTHLRNEANQLLEALQEAINISNKAGVRLHISHHKAMGRANWGSTVHSLRIIDEALNRRQAVTCDVYPYTAGSTMLTAVLPPWTLDGGPEALHRRLRDKTERERIRHDIETGLPGWESHSRLAGWDKIIIAYSKSRKDVEGKSIQQIADDENKSQVDVVFDLLLGSESAVSMLAFHICEDDIRRVISHRSSTICTDGLLGGKPHPRAYGAFPKIMRQYVREEKLLTWQDAIRKMTSLPASQFRLNGRGQIRVGAFADIVIFNPKTISDRSTYENPRQFAAGIEYVVVNGQIALSEGSQTDVRAGQIIVGSGTQAKLS